MHRFVLSVLMVLVAAAPAFAQVRIDVAEGRIAVSVDGRLFTALNTDMRVRKLYLDPVLTGSGKRVTRAFPMESVDGESTDHPHQRGIWIGAERVSGVDFWENVTERGPIRGGAFHELRASFAAYIPDSAVPLETSVQVVRPNFSTEGFSGTNWVRARSFQAGELLTIRRGRHDLRLGGEIGYLRARDSRPSGPIPMRRALLKPASIRSRTHRRSAPRTSPTTRCNRPPSCRTRFSCRRVRTAAAVTAIAPRVREELEHFAVAATALEGKDVRILGWGDDKAALHLIEASVVGGGG
jgi:hypothetical protein